MAKYASPRSPRSSQPAPPSPLAQQLPLVSARWLVACLVGIFGGGLALIYLTTCFLFWQGQWQILFQPARPLSPLQAAAQSDGNWKEVSFGANESGQPTLAGFLIAAEGDDRYAEKTILYLQDTRDKQSTAASIEHLRTLGINVFAFDYRGFGKSQPLHPSEKSASEDAEKAWNFLVDTRHVAPATIVLYGQGLGAALAAEAAVQHPQAAGIILDQPSPTALQIIHADPRSHGIPVSLLSHDRFDPTSALQASQLPKLFLLDDKLSAGATYAKNAANPKIVVHSPDAGGADVQQEAMKRFLDQLR